MGMVFKSVAGSEDTEQENHIHPMLMNSHLAGTVTQQVKILALKPDGESPVPESLMEREKQLLKVVL